MANRSYLCVSNIDTLYPNIGDPDYDPETNTVACDVYAVPLLWLALFRPGDMRTQVFEIDGEPVTGTAPIAKKDAALAQLARAVPTLNRLFVAEGPLDEYAERLRAGLTDVAGRFVTIEMEEIAGLRDPADFYRDFAAVLACFESAGAGAADRARMLDITQLRPGIPFPPARCFLDGLETSENDCWNHARLLGAEWVRPVPW